MKTITTKIIKLYQVFSKTVLRFGVFPLVFQSNCRFYPTCSDYTLESIEKFGVTQGLLKGTLRILKCNPFYDRNL